MTSREALRNALIIVLIFTVAGPLIGLTVVGLGLAIAGGDSAVFLFFIIYGILFAHLMGVVPALIAGALVAVYAAQRGRVPVWFGVVAGLVGMLGIRGVVHILTSTDANVAMTMQIIVPLTCAAAAAGATLLTRRWQIRRLA